MKEKLNIRRVVEATLISQSRAKESQDTKRKEKGLNQISPIIAL